MKDDNFGQGNNMVHAQIVTAVRGDGTPDGTTVVLADSASGVSFGTGIFHW